MRQLTLSPAAIETVAARLEHANREFAAAYPGDSGARQPVHTVYGGAHLFKPNSVEKLGKLALRAVEEFAAEPSALTAAMGVPQTLSAAVHERLRDKLATEPIEDYRLDFEDGYGFRPDEEEDEHAVLAGDAVAEAMIGSTLPPFCGIRIKPLNDELRARAVRTLDLFLTRLVYRAGATLPANFVVTLPKITVREQVSALADLFDLLEPALGLPAGSLRMEIMVETPQVLFHLDHLLEAARGRCRGAHFGVFDFTASVNITAMWQRYTHPAADFARRCMQTSFAGTGVWISDSVTNVMPVPVHRGASLTPEQISENRDGVHRAWRTHYDHVQHSLQNGFYQGWDLHPAQLVSRYAAVYSFFLEGLRAASDRLRNFMEQAAQATLIGNIFDDAASGQGLLNYFLRSISCGALREDEVPALTGLTIEELRSGSFAKIINGRAGGSRR